MSNSGTPTTSNLHFATSLTTVCSNLHLYKLLKFHFPNLMSYCVWHMSFQKINPSLATCQAFTMTICYHLAQPPSWSNTLFDSLRPSIQRFLSYPTFLQADFTLGKPRTRTVVATATHLIAAQVKTPAQKYDTPRGYGKRRACCEEYIRAQQHTGAEHYTLRSLVCTSATWYADRRQVVREGIYELYFNN